MHFSRRAPAGVFLPPSPWSWIDPGAFALIGAGAFMGGVTRMTLALAVIMMEVRVILTQPLPHKAFSDCGRSTGVLTEMAWLKSVVAWLESVTWFVMASALGSIPCCDTCGA